jgi:S-formylglutathione hydrolase FrmB
MNFAVYLPPQSEDGKLPVIYWLSGLSCTEQNFIMNPGVQRYASEHGIIIVAPDTSPSEHNFNFGFLGSRMRPVHRSGNLTSICELIV